MKTRISAAAFIAVLATTPAAVSGQTPRAGEPPLEMWTRAQTELGPTSEQVSRLEEIQRRLREQNRGLVEQLRAADAWAAPAAKSADERLRLQQERQQMREQMQDATPEERQRMREQMQRMREARPGAPRALRHARAQRQVPPELQPVVEQIRENSRSALEEAWAVLTPEQQELLRQVHRNRMHRPMGLRGLRGR